MSRFDVEKFFLDRGVSPEVVAARPYIRYTVDDRSSVRVAYRGLSPGQRAYMTKLAGRSDGFVITRHAPPGLGLAPVYPELRPDVPVATGPPTWHFHPSVRSIEPPVHPQTGRLLRARQIHTAQAMRNHIERTHHGVNDEGVHCHEHEAKYTFCPNRSVEERWWHDHDEQYAGKAEERAAHVGRWHGGVDGSGRHAHVSKVKDRRGGLARRLDLHPLAVDPLESRSRLFFVLEGCIKADAVLSQGEAVFSVPSVTLWEAPELKAFAERFLKEKTVFIVVDADALVKGEVMTQAKLCLSFLRRCGVYAYVALPPADRLAEGIKGVDDYLGKGAGRIDDLVVLDWELGEELVLFLVEAAEEYSWRHDRLERAGAALEGLALHAGESGTVRASLSTVARVMGVRPEQVSRGVVDLIASEAVSVDRPLRLSRGAWRGDRYVRALEWEERPTITLREHVRAHPVPPRQVKDVAGPPRQTNALARQRELWEQWTTPNEQGITPRDLAIMTDLLEGASIEEATGGWYRNPETARRRTRGMPWVTAMLHIMEEYDIFVLAAAGCTQDEIAAQTGRSKSTVQRVLRRGEINPRWLAALNPWARQQLELTLAPLIGKVKAGQSAAIEGRSSRAATAASPPGTSG